MSAETIAAPAGAAPGALRGRQLVALIVMLSGTFMVVLDFFIVNVALPAIQRDLDASPGTVQWVVAAYGLANAAGLITGGRLGDIHGRRRMFMLGLLLFALASLACGLATSGWFLVLARVLQGLAGALMQPQVLAMAGLVFTGAARARAFAGYGITLGLGAILGQLIGGALMAADPAGLGWRACFLINLPIAAAALLVAPRVIPPLANTGASRIDLGGTVLIAVASACIVLPLIEGRQRGWPAWAPVMLVLGVAALLLFGKYQAVLAARGGQPLVAPQLLHHRRFLVGLLTALVFCIGNASFYFVLALYLQNGLGLSALAAGLVFMALAIGFFVTSMAAPAISERCKGAPISRGAILLAAGHLLQLGNVAWWGGPHVVWWMLPILVVQGVGLGVVMAPLVSAVLSGLPPEHASVSSGVVTSVQQVGNALGVAVIGLIFFQAGGSTGASVSAAFAGSLVLLAVSAVAVAALFAWSRRMTDRPAPA